MNIHRRIYIVVSWLELWLVAAAVLAGMIWQPALIAAPIIGLVYALMRLTVERRFFGETPADFAVLLLVLLLPLNYVLSANPGQTVIPILRMLGGISLYYAAVHWGNSQVRLRWLAGISGLTILGLSLLAYVTVDWTRNKLLFIPVSIYERFDLLFQDAINPNVMGGSLIVFLPLTLALILFSWNKITWIERIFYPLVFLSASAVLVLTQTRGALLALIVALMVVLILRSSWFWSLPLLGLVVLAGVWYTIGSAGLLIQVNDLMTIEGVGQRSDIWLRTLYMIQDFPLSGVGMGHFPDAFRIFYPNSLDPSSYLMHAHNIYLQVAADLGLPGLVLWLSILLITIVGSCHVYRRGKRYQKPFMAALGAGLLGCLLATSLHGLVDSILWGEIRPAPLLWWMWGLVMAAFNVSTELQTGDSSTSSNQRKKNIDLYADNL